MLIFQTIPKDIKLSVVADKNRTVTSNKFMWALFLLSSCMLHTNELVLLVKLLSFITVVI